MKWETQPGSWQVTIFIGVLYLDKDPLLLLHIVLWKADGEDIRDKEGHWVGMEGAFNVWI